MTEKLYFEDSCQLSFEARVLHAREEDGKVHVTLDRTCFYPTSGGQPNDCGTVGGCEVVDVYLSAGDIIHVVEGTAPEGTVQCTVESSRRKDHMQQHTGQHILSQAIYRLLGAGTESLHIGAASSTIDIPVKKLTRNDVQRIELDANDIVFSDVPITTYEVDSLDETFRKSSAREGPLRIVEIEGYDKTPCGGTHCLRTGEVGLIKITDYFKKGSLWRIEFVCGVRALAHMQAYGDTIKRVTGLLNVPREDIPDKVTTLQAALKESERSCGLLMDAMAESLVEACIASAEHVGGIAVCSKIVDSAALAQKIGKIASGRERLVFVIGAPTDKGPSIIVAASSDSGVSAKDIIAPALEALSGKGGGSAQYASGRGTDNGLLEHAVLLARNKATGA